MICSQRLREKRASSRERSDMFLRGDAGSDLATSIESMMSKAPVASAQSHSARSRLALANCERATAGDGRGMAQSLWRDWWARAFMRAIAASALCLAQSSQGSPLGLTAGSLQPL